MNQGKIQVGSYSIIGDRTSQQDASRYGWQGGTLFAAVCDGMGGMAGGERASKQALDIMFRGFQAEQMPEEGWYSQWMQTAFSAADEAVASLADSAGNLLRAGTTVVSVMIRDNRLYWGSVGDSRIYYIKQNRICTITRMHNYNLRLSEMVASGEITEAQAQKEGERGEALISFLGIGGLPIIDTNQVPIIMEKGDIVILSSDGLYKSLDDQQVQVIVEESGGNMQIAARRLCDEALRLSVCKQDNTTVIVIKYCG